MAGCQGRALINVANTAECELEKAYTFAKEMRLGGRGTFSPIFNQGVRNTRGPLLVVMMPNGLTFPRIGISVPRRVGTAVKRNRIKRLLRESFRLMQHDFPAGYDVVVVVRPHEVASLADYQRLLSGLVIRGVASRRSQS